MIGPDFEFKVFQATGHQVNAQHISIFTKDNLEVFLYIKFVYANKLISIISKVKISVILWYFLVKDDLPLLHKSYGINYETAIENNARDALKVIV